MKFDFALNNTAANEKNEGRRVLRNVFARIKE
jgi:hypothetical protein